jgi:hypothetical protein
VFYKISRVGEFSLITELFLCCKFCGIDPRSNGPGPWSQLMSPRHSGSLSDVDSLIYGSYFIKTKGYDLILVVDQGIDVAGEVFDEV